MKKLISISLLLTCFSAVYAQSGVIKVKKKTSDELLLVMREAGPLDDRICGYRASGKSSIHLLLGTGYRSQTWTGTAGISFLSRSEISRMNLRWEYQEYGKVHMVFGSYQYALWRPEHKTTPHSVLSVGLDVGIRLSGSALQEFKPYVAYGVRSCLSPLDRFQLNLGYALRTGRQTENLSISNGPELALWFYL